MATVTFQVDPDNSVGTDYTSLAAAIAGEQINLVTAQDIYVFECISSAGTADTADADVDGYTTDADNYIEIMSPIGQRHAGVWSDSIYRLDLDATGPLIGIGENYTYVHHIQIHNPDTNDSNHGVADTHTACDEVRIDSVLVRIVAGTAIGLNRSLKDWVVTNCVVRSGGGGGGSEGYYLQGGASSSTMKVINCVAYNLNDGIERDAGTMTVTNCAVFTCLDDFDGTMTITNCASDDGDGTRPITPANWADVFVSVGSDFHLLDTDTDLTNLGLGPGSDANVPLFDFESDARSGLTTDIGADEKVAAPPAGWTGSINGVGDPGKVNGVGTGSITSINGVS